MAKLTKTSLFKEHVPKSATTMDKTNRIVRQIVDEESKLRQAKVEHLRNARLEKEVNRPTEDIAAVRKTSPLAVVTKR